jgi:hypothetical protein
LINGELLMATLRIILKQRLLSQEIRTVLHYAGGDAVHANVPDIIDYVRSVYATNLQSVLVNDWELYGASAKELDIVTNPTIDYTFSAGSLTGSDSSEPAPTQMALLVRWIALTARPNRGRTYLAGFPSGYFDSNGLWSSTLRSAANAWAADMLDITSVLTGLAQTITRVSKTTGALVGSNIVESYAIIANPSTQRRRRIGVGQ